jgi:hypothetical protein
MNIDFCRLIWLIDLTSAKEYLEEAVSENFVGLPEATEKEAASEVFIIWFVSQDIILLLYAYPKSEQDDLTPEQLKQLKRIVEKEYT